MAAELLYEGKAKQIFATNDAETVRVKYKNSATAFNGQKKAELSGKGALNNQISAILFAYLSEKGIPNHFVKRISSTEQLVQRVSILPIEVVVRNIAAGSLSKRLGLEEGEQLNQPIIEFYYKDDALGDPLINEDHIRLLNLAEEAQMKQIREIAHTVNQQLKELFSSLHIDLVDFKLEFGVNSAGELLIADEISPDTCRLWEQRTGKKLDKDRFRRDLGQVIEAYEEILNRLGGEQHV